MLIVSVQNLLDPTADREVLTIHTPAIALPLITLALLLIIRALLLIIRALHTLPILLILILTPLDQIVLLDPTIRYLLKRLLSLNFPEILTHNSFPNRSLLLPLLLNQITKLALHPLRPSLTKW